MKTSLCNLLGIEYPIMQGGMAWVSTAELAAAVSEAGGLGIIGSGHHPAEWVRSEIQKVKKMTQKPFGVNILLVSPHIEDIMKVIYEERVPVITTGAGNPAKYIPMLKENDTKVIPVVASVALAQRLEKTGVDAVIAEGTESGGHVGELTTMVLVPQVVDAVKIPVIAAGGIANGRGLIAAMALGAVGAQIGTRFMCASECTIHDNVKQAILKAKDRDTVVTGRSTTHPVRALKNKLTKLYLEREKNGAPEEELEQLGVGSVRKAMVEGDTATGTMMAGQISGMVNEVKPAREILIEIMQQADNALDNLEVKLCR